MPIFRPNELIAFLDRLGRGAKRTLSQNFLIDGNIARNIVEKAAPQADDTILEIGPGPGVITEFFFGGEASPIFPIKQVLAIEKDDQFAHELARFSGNTRASLHVFHEDALTFSFEEIIPKYVPDWQSKPVKLISNLPYHLTTPLLEKILAIRGGLISSVTVMVQHEVGKKITAHARKGSYLALFHAYYTEEIEYAFFVPRTCFMPQPNVDSCVIHMKMRQKPLLSREEEVCFFKMIKQAFLSKRKTLSHSLRSFESSNMTISDALSHISLSKSVRPEELSLDNWLQLFDCIISTNP